MLKLLSSDIKDSYQLIDKNLSGYLFFIAADGGIRTNFFYHDLEKVSEANESKLSSEGEIRTDISNTDESFNLDLEQYINFCDDPKEDNLVYSESSRRRSRSYVLKIQDVDVD